MSSELTAEYVRSILDYDAETGVFTWVNARGNLKAGSVAGTVDYQGYVRISINERRYRAHRLAWLYVHGEKINVEIDHINGVKSDNRIANLRTATRSQNEANKAKTQKNTSGYKGVSWHKDVKKWIAHIMVNQKAKYLGSFSTREEAHKAYCSAANDIFGEFANVG
jgi:hypothetical protein